MDGSQKVSFGRRGLPHNDASSALAGFGHARAADVGPHVAHDIAPSMVVERSISRLLMYVGAIWLLIFLTAGHTRHGNDLPFWMRPDAEFHLRNYLFPLVFCSLATLLALGPALRRPVALKLFDDHFEFLPLIGAARMVRWSAVGDIVNRGWGNNKCIYVEVSGSRRVRIPTGYLTRSRDEIASLLEYSRSHAGFRNLHLSGEPIDGRYVVPGH